MLRVPFERDEGVAGKELVWVELGDAGLGLPDYEIGWLVEVLTYPAVLLQRVHRWVRVLGTRLNGLLARGRDVADCIAQTESCRTESVVLKPRSRAIYRFCVSRVPCDNKFFRDALAAGVRFGLVS